MRCLSTAHIIIISRCTLPTFLYNTRMSKMAVIRSGGKQYLVKENEELFVEKLDTPVDQKIELEVLSTFDEAGEDVQIGKPLLDTKVSAQIVGHEKGDKLHVYKFKSKVRYRRKMGHRHELTRIKILSI